MTPTERNQIRDFADSAESAIRAIAKKPGKKERMALEAINKIRQVVG